MKDISMMTPAEIAFKYDGDKRKIAAAVQNGVIPPTLGALAGIFIDRVQKSGTQAPQRTVAQDIFEGEQQPSGGVAALPVDESMYNMAGGGIVAFAGREGSFVETRPGFYELEDEGDDKIFNPDRAREFVDVYRSLLPPQAASRAELAELYKSAGKRGEAAASKQRALAGIAAASKLLSTRGDFTRALGAAGEAAIPGLTKAEETAMAAEEAGLKGRLGLEEKERAEELEAIKGGMNLYGRAVERRIAAGKDLAMDKYAKNFLEAYRSNPRFKDMSDAQILQLGREDYLNRSGAALMRGQAAMGQVGVSAGQLDRQIMDNARTKVENRIKGDFRLRNQLSKLERDDPAAYEQRINEMMRAEVERMTGGGGTAPAAPAAPAPAAAPTSSLAPASPRKSASIRTPPQAAIDILKGNDTPAQRRNFDAVFGEGAAARALGSARQ